MTSTVRHVLLAVLCVVLCACDPIPKLEKLNGDAIILAFGDSITFGTGAQPEQAYPTHLQTLTSRTVINAGIPGELSSAGLRRLPGLLERHRPELIIICHGGNDILRRTNSDITRNNIQQMIDLSRSRNVQVILVGVPNFGIFLSSAEFYTELADENQLPLENTVLPDILANATLKADHIHPNANGYKVMAGRLYDLLENSDAI